MPKRKRPLVLSQLKRLRMNLLMDGRFPATQQQVATAIRVGLNRYFSLENGLATPTPRERKALARVFHVHEKALHLYAQESDRVLVRDEPEPESRSLQEPTR